MNHLCPMRVFPKKMTCIDLKLYQTNSLTFSTLTTRQLLTTNCLSVFDHSVGLSTQITDE